MFIIFHFLIFYYYYFFTFFVSLKTNQLKKLNRTDSFGSIKLSIFVD